MTFKEYETKILALEKELIGLDQDMGATYHSIQTSIHALQKEAMTQLTAYDKVYLARHPLRIKSDDYIEALFDSFIELKGDRHFGDDKAIKMGVAMFNGQPVSVIAQIKGQTLETQIETHFGMPHPEGYRKVLRMIKQSEKFNRPIITFIDTPGAYPGVEAEQRGQAEAIASCLAAMSSVKVPVIAIVIGEGGSGGALALSVSDHLMMLEHSIYSILSPEGFATILWKDGSRAEEAAALMGITAQDLYAAGIVDEVIKEPVSLIHRQFEFVLLQLKQSIEMKLNELNKKSTTVLLKQRYKKFRNLGSYTK